MTQPTKPINGQEHQVENRPPPSLEEIRRQLGWGLVEAERETTNRSEQ